MTKSKKAAAATKTVIGQYTIKPVVNQELAEITHTTALARYTVAANSISSAWDELKGVDDKLAARLDGLYTATMKARVKFEASWARSVEGDNRRQRKIAAAQARLAKVAADLKKLGVNPADLV